MKSSKRRDCSICIHIGHRTASSIKGVRRIIEVGSLSFQPIYSKWDDMKE
jgi:hypothetical protein